MDTNLRDRKQAIRDFMRANYTDERLAALLAHAQSGKLLYTSCCCFIGVANADHALASRSLGELLQQFGWARASMMTYHYYEARELPGAIEAEEAYLAIAGRKAGDSLRRRILIPMIKAEMRRRDRLALVKEWKEELALVTT